MVKGLCDVTLDCARDQESIAPGAARRYAPADSSSTVTYRFAANQAICVSPWIQKSLRIYVRPRTGPQSPHLWWPAVAKLQDSQCAYSLGSCAMRQTDGWNEGDLAPTTP